MPILALRFVEGSVRSKGLDALVTLSWSLVWLERNSAFCSCFGSMGLDYKSSATTLLTKEATTFQRLSDNENTSRMLIWISLNI